MNIETMLPRLAELFGPQVIRILAAILVLFVGWLFARMAAWGVRKALLKTTIDNRISAWILGDEKGSRFEVEPWVGRIVYYVLLAFVILLFFNTLQLTVVSEPLLTLLNRVFGYLPQLFGAGILLAVAWIIAVFARRSVRAAASRFRLDEKVGGEAGLKEGAEPGLGKSLGDAIYWLVFLLFLPNILGALELQGLLQPVQSMVDRLLSFLPNVFAALVILGIGWFIARVVQRIVTSLLAAVGVDRFGERIGLGEKAGTRKLSGLIGLVVYVFVLFNVLVSSLHALSLEAITAPATSMLTRVLEAIPLIFAASILVALAFYVGRLVAQLSSNVLAGAGFDSILLKLGLAKEGGVSSGRRPSELAGTLLLTAIMLFASIEAAGLLGFDNLATLMSGFLSFAGQLVLGIIVFGVGLFLANLAAQTIRASGSAQAGILATAARIGVLVLSTAVALRQMGIANEIIELAFGLVLGSVAVAAAIAFGLGGREVAAKQVEAWRESLR
ncbi:MAG TPA: mechanosensitive ion channel [Vicinamibacteria bacterium]|nr:mechanosensitive ion channel [Vicinamibacteria bacterium]